MKEQVLLMDAREEGREEERANTEAERARANAAEARAVDAETRAKTAEAMLAKYIEKYGDVM